MNAKITYLKSEITFTQALNLYTMRIHKHTDQGQWTLLSTVEGFTG